MEEPNTRVCAVVQPDNTLDVVAKAGKIVIWSVSNVDVSAYVPEGMNKSTISQGITTPENYMPEDASLLDDESDALEDTDDLTQVAELLKR